MPAFPRELHNSDSEVLVGDIAQCFQAVARYLEAFPCKNRKWGGAAIRRGIKRSKNEQAFTIAFASSFFKCDGRLFPKSATLQPRAWWFCDAWERGFKKGAGGRSERRKREKSLECVS